MEKVVVFAIVHLPYVLLMNVTACVRLFVQFKN